MDAAERARWQRIDALFEAALEQPEHARLDWLQQACAEPELRACVLDLLRREQDAAGPLEALAAKLGEGVDSERLRGRELGGWQLVELLGEGGMATVWRATREVGGYTRETALKCLKLGLYSPDLRQRFAAEQSILARLEHPNIARLYEAGIGADGTPFLAMELVRGLDLIRHADAQRLDTAQRIALFLKVVEAVAYAHRELVVHRDLKPANIVVDAAGEPRLLDFGIARLIEPGSGRVATTALRPHTPEYAAPEQLRGEPVGVRADVYALGLLLHELLCGERAPAGPQQREQGTPSTQLRRSGRRDAIADLRRRSGARLLRELRGDLDLIVQRCLRVEPAQRYPSAEALADELQRWQQRRPISARQGHRRYRLRRFLQRHWLPLAATALVLLSLSLGIALALREAQRADAAAVSARRAQAAAEREAERAQALRGFLLGLFQADLPGRARDAMPSTRELVDQGIARARDPATGPAELRADMLLALGEIVLARLQFEQAASLLEEAKTLLGGAEIAPPEAWARVLLQQVDLHRRQRQYVAMDAALDSGIAWLEIHLPASIELLELLRERALLRLRLEQPDAAERQLLALRQRLQDRDGLGSLPLRVAGDLASVYGMQGRMREAAALQAEVLAMKQADPTTTAGSLATTVFNLGSAAFALGEIDSARDRFEQALSLLASVDSPMQVRAASLHALARLEHALGHADRALQRERESAQEWARALGLVSTDEDFFEAFHTGRILADLGRRAEALTALQHAITRMQARQDAPPVRIAEAQSQIARLHCEAGDIAAAANWLEQARATLDADSNTDSSSAAVLVEARARCALAEGRADAAVELLQDRRVRTAERAEDPEFDLLRVETLLAEALQAAGRVEEARALATELQARLDRIGADPLHPLRPRLQPLLR